MEKILRPERLDIEPDDKVAEKQWKHWLKTFSNFMVALSSADHSQDRLSFDKLCLPEFMTTLQIVPLMMRLFSSYSHIM